MAVRKGIIVDDMTKDKAIWWLEWLKKVHTERWICEALDTAIEALHDASRIEESEVEE